MKKRHKKRRVNLVYLSYSQQFALSQIASLKSSVLFDYVTVLQNPGARRLVHNTATQDIRERLPLPLRRKNRYRLLLRGKIQRNPQHAQGMLPVARFAVCLFRPRHKYQNYLLSLDTHYIIKAQGVHTPKFIHTRWIS